MLELRLLLCEDKFNESNVSHASACVWSVILGWVVVLGTIIFLLFWCWVDALGNVKFSSFVLFGL